MNQHPIVPLEKTQLPASAKRTAKKSNERLILNVKVKNIDFNFYKGISYKTIDEFIRQLIDHD